MSLIGRRTPVRAVLSLCAVAAACVVLNAAIAGGSTVRQRLAPDPASVARPANSGATENTAIDPQLVSQLSVFRRAARAADVMPNGLQQWLGSTVPQFAPDTAQSRHVIASDGENAFLTPGTNAICVAGTGSVGSFCASTSAFAAGQAATVDLCSPELPKGQIQIEWMLPDTATNVAVVLSDGTAIKLPAANVFIKRFPISGALPHTIAWDSSGSRHAVSAGVPADVKRMDCVHPGDVLSNSSRSSG